MTEEETRIATARKAVANRFIRGSGLEVGAGSRPFPVPEGVRVRYGDIRDSDALEKYFGTQKVRSGVPIDAQTLAGIPDQSVDFVISAHVIEHLCDPIGSLVQSMRVLKPGGILVLVVPEMRKTFDRTRPETTVDHALADYLDGGADSCAQSYDEHLRYVHPYLTGENLTEEEIQKQIRSCVPCWHEHDIHFHAWTSSGFRRLLWAASGLAPIRIIQGSFVVNENIFVLRKMPALSFWWRKIRRRLKSETVAK